MNTDLIFYAFALPLLHLPLWAFLPWKKSVAHLIPNLLFIGFELFLLLTLNGTIVLQLPFWLGETIGSASTISLKLDSYRLSMALVSSSIAWLIQIYSFSYLHGSQRFALYQFLISAFAAAMSWLFLSANLFSLLLGWELVGIFSYLLVQFWMEKENPVKSGLKVLLINKLGDIFLISALGLLVSYGFGHLVFDQLQFQNANIPFFQTKPGQVIALFILVSAMVKSAQFPFNLWLKEAMEGPTSVSALLHSATMVTGGIWLILQCTPLFSAAILDAMVVIGGITLIMSNLGAIFSMKIKSLFAFSTMAQLGLMLIGLGLLKTEGVQMHLFSHAFFKSSLFLTAGVLMTMASKQGFFGNQNQHIPNLKGYLNPSGPLKWAFVLCLSALAGLPFTSGFLSKESLVPHVFSGGSKPIEILAFIFIQLGILMTSFYSFRLLIWIAFSKNSFEEPAKPAAVLVVPVLILSLGAGFWLFGPNPFSSDGWLTRFWGMQGHWVFPDVIMSLSGLFLAWLSIRKWTYYNVTSAHRFRVVFSELKQQENLFLAPWKALVWFSSASLKVENRWIDRPLDFGSKVAVVSGHITAFFDRRVVDGFVSGLAWVAKELGTYFWRQSTGKPQQTVFLVILILALLTYFFS